MCLSPHEMTTAQIENRIARLQAVLDDPRTTDYKNMYRGRLEGFEKILKERAEAGTI